MSHTPEKHQFSWIKKIQIFRLPLIVIIASGILTINLIRTLQVVGDLQAKRRIKPYSFIGDQFAPIKAILKNESRVGYWSDRSLDDRQAAALLAQAQYVLTPSILELNALDHHFVIFDCRNKQDQINIIRTLGLKPLKISPAGFILAENPNIK